MSKRSEDWFEIFPDEKSLAHDHTKLSPREFPIVLVALYDVMLVKMLKRRLLNDKAEVKRVLSGDELGSFGSRVTFAYLLGIISKDEAQIMRLTASIRNIFAHCVTASFKDEDVAAKTREVSELYIKRITENAKTRPEFASMIPKLKSSQEYIGKTDTAAILFLGSAHAAINGRYWRSYKHIVRLEHAISPFDAEIARSLARIEAGKDPLDDSADGELGIE